ncbi:HemK methyltransferase member 1, partial [Nowakowskiella sp. JEL0078]
DFLAIVWKPSGLTLKGQPTKTLELALGYVITKSQTSDALDSPICISEFDKATPGIIVVAKTNESLSKLKHMRRNNHIVETHRAIVLGSLGESKGMKIGESRLIEEPINGWPASSCCTLISESETNNGILSTVEVSPVVGKDRFQIRYHLLNWGHPVIGNTKYTHEHRSCRNKGLYQACIAVKFIHPHNGVEISIREPEPSKFEALRIKDEKFFLKKKLDTKNELASLNVINPMKILDGFPVAYNVGFKEFRNLQFAVNESTMIPRQATECLVQAIVESEPLYILDLGTGSGCILLSILNELPECVGIGIDLSKGALNVARKNADKFHLLNRATFIEGDFADLSGIQRKISESNKQIQIFDVIVCNPPYLTEKLVKNYNIIHEPQQALVAGETGLESYKTLVDSCKKLDQHLLRKGGLFIVEVGNGMDVKVKSIFISDSRNKNKSKQMWSFVRSLIDKEGFTRGLVFRLL